MRLLLFATLLIPYQLVSAVSTVGRPCANDAECPGENEYCNIVTHLDPPCQTGFCACKHCFTLDPVAAKCSPTVYKTLNDPCTEDDAVAVLPKNAECRNGFVFCKIHYAFIDGICVRTEPNGDYGQVCGPRDPCDGELICGTRFSACTCPNPGHRWDVEHAKCVPRDYGDYCTIDSDCDPSSDDIFAPVADNAGTMVCKNGVCRCANGFTEAPASYIEPHSGDLVEKTVCQGFNSTMGLGKSQKCNIRPVTFAGSALNVCDTTMTCFQCPDDLRKTDFTSFDGACRALGEKEEKPRTSIFLSFIIV